MKGGRKYADYYRLAKGRLAKMSAKLFAACGLNTEELLSDSRKLVFHDEANQVNFLMVKPSDVPVYVDHGIADIGIVGKDTLMEARLPLYEMVDLKYAACSICVAGYAGERKKSITSNILRVATKYPNIAKMYYDAKGENIEIIKLNAPLSWRPCLACPTLSSILWKAAAP